EKFRQRARAPEAQALEVVVERGVKIAARGLPKLQRAELRNAVFHIVERNLKDVELPVPDVGARLLEAAPVFRAAETVHEREPVLRALPGRMLRVRVDPVL